MTIKHLFPPSKPTLDLNFAATRQLDRRITFTRSSTGTYIDADGIVRTAAEDEARFNHDPVTGESLGLLIEESRTNYIQNSTDFNAGDWSFATAGTAPGPAVCTSNSGTAPDGTNTATRMVCDTGGGTSNGDSCYLRCNRDSTTRQVVSIWIKSNTGSDQTIYMTVQQQPVIATNTWKRILALSKDFRVGARGDISQQNVDILIWGVQVEDGDNITGFHTSHIPTSGGSATRATDVASITGTNFSSWYNQSEGTLLTSITPYGVTNNDYAYSFSDGTSDQRIVSLIGATDSHYVVEGGIIQAQINYAGYTANTRTNAAATYAFDSAVYATDGVIRGADTSVIPPSVDRLVLMASRANDNHASGYISRLAYYPRRLTDEQLQALTS